MAEIVGTIASAITLAALFKSCVDAFEIIKTAHNQEYDLRKLVLKLNLERCRLYTWGEAMGLTPGSKEQPPTATCQFHDVMTETLQMLLRLFEDSERLSKVYGCKEFLDITGDQQHSTAEVKRLTASFNNFGSKRAKWRQKGTKVLNQAKWAVHDRQKFQCFITDIKDYIDGLQHITAAVAPPARQDSRMQERIITVEDPDTLDMISETCQNDYPEIAKAASDRADSLSTVTTGRWKIEHWECADTKLITDTAFDIEALDVTELKHHVYRMAKEQQELRNRLERVQTLLTDPESTLSRSVDDSMNMPLTRRSILELRMPLIELGLQPTPIWMEPRLTFPKLAPAPWNAVSSLKRAARALDLADGAVGNGQDYQITKSGSASDGESTVKNSEKNDGQSDSGIASGDEVRTQSMLTRQILANQGDAARLEEKQVLDQDVKSDLSNKQFVVEQPSDVSQIGSTRETPTVNTITSKDVQASNLTTKQSSTTPSDEVVEIENETAVDGTPRDDIQEPSDSLPSWSNVDWERFFEGPAEESMMSLLSPNDPKTSILKVLVNLLNPGPSKAGKLVHGFQDLGSLSDENAFSSSQQSDYFTLTFNISAKSMHPQLVPSQGHTHYVGSLHVAKIIRSAYNDFDLKTWPRSLSVTEFIAGEMLDRSWAKISAQFGIQLNVFAVPATSPIVCRVAGGGCLQALFGVLAANGMYARCMPEILKTNAATPAVYLVPLGKSIRIPRFVLQIHPNFQPGMDMFLVIVWRFE